jgi:hypothetical protein
MYVFLNCAYCAAQDMGYKCQGDCYAMQKARLNPFVLVNRKNTITSQVRARAKLTWSHGATHWQSARMSSRHHIGEVNNKASLNIISWCAKRPLSDALPV